MPNQQRFHVGDPVRPNFANSRAGTIKELVDDPRSALWGQKYAIQVGENIEERFDSELVAADPPAPDPNPPAAKPKQPRRRCERRQHYVSSGKARGRNGRRKAKA
jgi:hypothetical protein